ncbi:phage portal protein [Nocardioides sp. LHD-245]|uniref:phage portal protein n=1 Tax=Nocardioides sp. LHD-245 TaxID=3051387 RepID=UPI0027E1D95D|nr:phage portal protein [Nocardioides sp. LHD-245]
MPRLWESVLTRNGSRGQPANVSLEELLEVFNDPNREILPTSWGNHTNEEAVASVGDAYRRSGPVFALSLARMQVFSQANFQWTRSKDGTPSDMFGSQELSVLEVPWPGARTPALLSRMEADDTSAGNAFIRRVRRLGEPDRLVRLRPSWVTVLLGSEEEADAPWEAPDVEVLGYAYRPSGDAGRTLLLEPHEVAHYMPIPDPTANYRGMSWVTPVLTGVKADEASEVHKSKLFDNAATPNFAIKFDPTVTVDQVMKFKELFENEHKGRYNAFKTLFLGGGADPVTVGQNFREMEFAATQAKGETRLAAAAGVPPTWVGFSEGLAGSSLNEGNYRASQRRFADGTAQHLWEAAAMAFETILDPPATRSKEPPARLVVDPRSVPFLREDLGDAADARSKDATTIKSLIDGGFTAESAVAAVKAGDLGLLKHSGLISVQLQKPGSTTPTEGGSDA